VETRSAYTSSPQGPLAIMEPMLPLLGMLYHALLSLMPIVKAFPSSTAGLMA
jgi:hypothetical protein